MFSDRKLGLEAKWFTGRAWADGTAERELRAEYQQRERELRQRLNGHQAPTNERRVAITASTSTVSIAAEAALDAEFEL